MGLAYRRASALRNRESGLYTNTPFPFHTMRQAKLAPYSVSLYQMEVTTMGSAFWP